MRLNDEEFNAYMESVYDLDWTGLDLTLVGAIVSDTDTQDIDCTITGEIDDQRLMELLWAIQDLGPFDINWSDREVSNHFDTYRRKVFFAWSYKPREGKEGHLTKKWIKLPTTKQIERKKRGFKLGEPLKVIQNGTRIYL